MLRSDSGSAHDRFRLRLLLSFLITPSSSQIPTVLRLSNSGSAALTEKSHRISCHLAASSDILFHPCRTCFCRIYHMFFAEHHPGDEVAILIDPFFSLLSKKVNAVWLSAALWPEL